MNTNQEHYSTINESIKNIYDQVVHGGKNINTIKKRLNTQKGGDIFSIFSNYLDMILPQVKIFD